MAWKGVVVVVRIPPPALLLPPPSPAHPPIPPLPISTSSFPQLQAHASDCTVFFVIAFSAPPFPFLVSADFSTVSSSFVAFPATLRTLLTLPHSLLLCILSSQPNAESMSLYTLPSTFAEDRFGRISYVRGLVHARNKNTHKTRPPKRVD